MRAAAIVRAFEWACACGAPGMVPGPHYVGADAAREGLVLHACTDCPLPAAQRWGVVTATSPVLT